MRIYSFHNHVKAFRKLKGISQSDLGYMCFLSQNTISDIENEKICPKVSNAILIANALCEPVENIFWYEIIDSDKEL